MKFHYSMGLVGVMAVVLIITWYGLTAAGLGGGAFALTFGIMSVMINGPIVFLYIRTFAEHMFPELEGIIKLGAHHLYDNLLKKVEKHSQLPASNRKLFVYPDSLNNAHRGIIEYIPRYRGQRNIYVKHYTFIIEELRSPDCNYELVIEQIEELKALLDE